MQVPAGRRLRFLLIALLSHRVPGVSMLIGCGPRSVKPCGLLLLTGLQERRQSFFADRFWTRFQWGQTTEQCDRAAFSSCPRCFHADRVRPPISQTVRIAVADRFAGAEFADRFWARFQWGQTTEQCDRAAFSSCPRCFHADWVWPPISQTVPDRCC